MRLGNTRVVTPSQNCTGSSFTTHACLHSLFEVLPIFYNVELSKLRADDENIEKHCTAFEAWAGGVDEVGFREWQLPRFWEILSSRQVSLPSKVITFVTEWHRLLCEGPASLLNNSSAIKLVTQREKSLKGNRSRFTNARSLDQWGGNTGTGLPVYRWNIVSTYLNDLHQGLRSDDRA